MARAFQRRGVRRLALLLYHALPPIAQGCAETPHVASHLSVRQIIAMRIHASEVSATFLPASYPRSPPILWFARSGCL